LHFNCDSEVPAVGTGSTSIYIIYIYYIYIIYKIYMEWYGNAAI